MLHIALYFTVLLYHPFSLPNMMVLSAPCVNYRALNEITIENHYPIPSAKALTNCLAGSTIISKVEIRSAFNQIRVTRGHV